MTPKALTLRPQWVCWEYQERQGKKTKVPLTPGSGKLASTTDPSTWGTYGEAISHSQQGKVGYVFSADDGLVGIDLDDVIVGGMLLPWAANLVANLNSYTEVSPSGNGLKVWVKGTWEGRGRKARPAGGGAIEVYTQGRYFTVTGDEWAFDDVKSHHLADRQGALDWMRSKYFPAQESPALPQTPSTLMALDVIELANSAANGAKFHELFNLGNGSNPSGSEAHLALGSIVAFYTQDYATWLEVMRASVHASHAKFARDDYLKRTFEKALQQSDRYEPPRQASAEDVSGVYLGELLDSIDETDSAATDMPASLLHVPGLMGEVMRWVQTQNPRDNRKLALVAAISLQAALCSRKVRDTSGQRTNLYIVATAPSGGGKQAPQTCLKRILSKAGLSSLYGGKVASDSAIAEDLTVSPAKLYLWDEFGRFLKKTQEGHGNRDLHAVQELLLELWNSTSVDWKHKSLADKTRSREAQQPCLSFTGFTVSPSFWEGLDEQHLLDGFAARMLYIDCDVAISGRGRDIEESEPPDAIIEVAKFWGAGGLVGNLADQNPMPHIVTHTDGAGEVFSQLVDEAFEPREPIATTLWSRAIEKAKRLALCYACSESHEAPEIDAAAAQWGCDLVRWSTSLFERCSKQEVHDGSVFAQQRQKVLRFIKERTDAGQCCTRSQLLKRTKLPSRQLQQVLDTLEESRQVQVMTGPSTGRGRTAELYKLKGAQ